MTPQADFDMTRRVQELRYAAIRRGQECYRDNGKNSNDCWCMGCGLKGAALPCPVRDEELPAADTRIPL